MLAFGVMSILYGDGPRIEPIRARSRTPPASSQSVWSHLPCRLHDGLLRRVLHLLSEWTPHSAADIDGLYLNRSKVGNLSTRIM
jgi:hypothetical protein